MKLSGKNALVTGSDQGIGQGIALRLAQEGADVVVNYRKNQEGADATCEQIRQMGRRTAAVQADVGVTADARRLVEEAIAALGSLDILVNNAGIEKNASFVDITEEDYHAVIAVTMSGAFFCTQSFARHRQDVKGGGRVINISSVHEELPFPHFTPYCMAKGGLKMMMRNLAIELAPLGITVNNVAPGAIETPINKKLLSDPKLLEPLLANIPLRRLGQPSDVAGVTAFLASADADYITAATIVVDGGLLWNYSEQ
ncbi:MAG: short-chain dehydrogenase/reductase [Candidatus Solibacter sp.]|jgi:glucose 1-dehydrogenase|nr:short-chain dehydrogenase/reductase [Candidatus Solibacter sp.]